MRDIRQHIGEENVNKTSGGYSLTIDQIYILPYALKILPILNEIENDNYIMSLEEKLKHLEAEKKEMQKAIKEARAMIIKLQAQSHKKPKVIYKNTYNSENINIISEMPKAVEKRINQALHPDKTNNNKECTEWHKKFQQERNKVTNI